MNVIGKANVAIDQALSEFTQDVWDTWNHSCQTALYNRDMTSDIDEDVLDKAIRWFRYTGYSTFVHELTECNQFLNSVNYEYPFDLISSFANFSILCLGEVLFAIPDEYVDKRIFAEHDSISDSDVSTNLPAIATSGSISDQKSKIESANADIDELSKSIESIKYNEIPELAELQAEIDRQKAELEAKKQSMLDLIRQKQAELEEKKLQMEDQLYMIESQLYSIQCFSGETVSFAKLRSGSSSKLDYPLTLFQKIRYLDEELGRICSLYDVDASDIPAFETLISVNDIVFDQFCPNNKCVSLVRVSKSNRYFIHEETIFGQICETAKKFHGEQIGILIRDGENLYIGWTDDKKIKISDDNFFFGLNSNIGDADDVNSADDVRRVRGKFMSRMFIFSILQGVLEHSDMINLPKVVKLYEESEYVKHSTADGWIPDNKYGSFKDILNKTQIDFKVGHSILIWENITDGHYSGNMYGLGYRQFDRGRGCSKLTGEASIRSGEIYPINVIDKSDPYYIVYYNKNGVSYRSERLYSQGAVDSYISDLEEGCEVRHTDKLTDTDIYVSVLRDGGDSEFVYDDPYWGSGRKLRERASRANMRVDPSEFIDLTYLNSDYIRYVIVNRKLDISGEHGEYAVAIKYLNKAIEFLTNRETQEAAELSKFLDLSKLPDWRIRLSDWKIDNKVSNITEYQAKRFSKTIK